MWLTGLLNLVQKKDLMISNASEKIRLSTTINTCKIQIINDILGNWFKEELFRKLNALKSKLET